MQRSLRSFLSVDVADFSGLMSGKVYYYMLVSKLKKIKTKFLHFTGYLSSIKNPIKQDLLLILVLARQQNYLNC